MTPVEVYFVQPFMVGFLVACAIASAVMGAALAVVLIVAALLLVRDILEIVFGWIKKVTNDRTA